MHGLGDGTAGLPAGSTLVYYATWQLSELSHLTTFTSPSGVAAQIAPLAAAQGINITVGTAVGFLASVSSFTLNITTTADRNADTDVKAVLDNLIYQSVGVMPTSSIVLTSVLATANAPAAVTPTNPTAAAADLAAYNAAIANGDSVGAAAALAQYKIDTGTALLPSNPLAWVESNALYICGGILAFILLREFA